jgi:PAS domain S-box-containing protein
MEPLFSLHQRVRTVSQAHGYLLTFSILGILSIILLIFSLFFSYRQTENTIKISSANEAHILASQMDATLRRIRSGSDLIIETLLQNTLAGTQLSPQVGGVNQHLEALGRYFPEVSGHLFYNAAGQLLFNGNPGLEPLDIKAIPLYHQIKDHPQGGLFFSETLQAHAEHPGTVIACQALLDEAGALQGIIVTPVNLLYFNALFSMMDVGKEGMVSIRRSDTSRLVVRWPKNLLGINKEARDIPPQQQVQAGVVKGVVRYVGRTDGVDRIFAFHSLPDFPFYVLVGRAVSEQFAGWYRMATISSALTCTGILLLGLFLYRLKTSEQRLHRSEFQYQAIVENQHDAVCRWLPDTTLTFANEQYKALFSSETNDLIGRRWVEFAPPNKRAAILATFARVAEGDKPISVENSVVLRDGTVRSFHWITGPLLDAQGKCVEFQSVGRDITERKQAETALLAERQNLIDIIDSLPDATLIIDTDQRLVVWNKAAEVMTGVQRDGLLGQGDYAYAVPFYGERRPILIDLLTISEQEREGSYADIHRVKESIYAETFIQRLNNGEGAYLCGIAAPLYDRSGVRTGAIEVIKDITALKKSEQSNSLLQEQLLQSQKMEAIGQLAGGVAHDFNNMLGVIIGYSELILEQVNPSQQFHTELEEIRKAAQRSAELTRQLLTFARKQTVVPKVLDLNQTVEGMLNMLRRLIGENINLIWMPGINLWPINMDPSQIDQILANLCVNARDAIAGVGKIAIETENALFDEQYCHTHAGFMPGEYVKIAVSDTGKGMSRETLSHIFEPFFTTKRVGEGTGLGLSTVYGAVKQNNGFINTYSEPGQGTTCTIYLPRHVARTTEANMQADAAPVRGGDEVILLVEDEPTILVMARVMLESLGYTVLAAGSPSQAIHLAGEFVGQIDLLLTDVVMPEMNGRDLMTRIGESRPATRYLFMSGYTANIIAKQGMLEEGIAFIQKPFAKSDLAAKVREVLG